eukprot:1157595-Pelagomonas_calceolata.AAC.16
MQSKRVEEMMRAHEDDAVQTGDKAMVVMGFMRMMQCKQAVVMMSAHGGDASGRCMKHKARLEGETRERCAVTCDECFKHKAFQWASSRGT